jgi:hypothetical protein
MPTLWGNSRVPPQRHTENYRWACTPERDTSVATREPWQTYPEPHPLQVNFPQYRKMFPPIV